MAINTKLSEQDWPPFCWRHIEIHFQGWNHCILNQISLTFVPSRQIGNEPLLVQIMDWCRTGDKPLPETMLWLSEHWYVLNYVITATQFLLKSCDQVSRTFPIQGVMSKTWILRSLNRFMCQCSYDVWNNTHEITHEVMQFITWIKCYICYIMQT